MSAGEALQLSEQITVLIDGRTAGTQGAALARAVSIFIARCRPDQRDETLALLLEHIRTMVPISDREFFPDGWRAP